MREHQIVITLKPEQFLEVQRLARAANAKSMGLFVRQKLLAALGIEGGLALSSSGESALSPQAVTQILTELHRLHGELKGFVAESVAHYSIEPIAEKPAAISPAGESSVMNDDFEELAGRTFAISPRLGELESPQAVPDAQKPDPLDVVPPMRDPLDVLLNEESLRRLSKPQRTLVSGLSEEEEDEDYIPLSLRQKRSERAEPEKAAPFSQDDQDDQKSAEEDATGPPNAATADAVDDAAELEETAKPTSPEPPPSPPSVSGGNTPFSGGPPPKRRKE
jgi:hypothetical protein